MLKTLHLVICGLLLVVIVEQACAQSLEQVLLQEEASALINDARDLGKPERGAILFHQVHVGCVKCHAVDGTTNSLGPDLTKLADQPDADDAHLVRSVLQPSKSIRKGYETMLLQTVDGRSISGLFVRQSDDEVVLRDPLNQGGLLAIPRDQIEQTKKQSLSIMPAGVVNQLGSRQQFLDLISFLMEIREGGVKRARELQPPPGLITLTVPEYEQHLDHAGLLTALDDDAFERGKEIYNRLCINCHGDLNRPGSLPTALRFGEGKFKNGSDPHSLYRTLTYGFGLMVPQTWMVPKQKYDVIHYVRETYLKRHNPTQYTPISDQYLASLPSGETLGPDPIPYAPWSDMNYGPAMINTFEVGSDGSNFAYKGIAIRLDAGPGGVAKGNSWAIFDHDTMRIAAVWERDPSSNSTGFINWQGIHFDGRHGTHPRIVGNVQFQNKSGPGWADPQTGSFADDQRVVGRDARMYGPLPKSWARYHGLHVAGGTSIVDYSIGRTRMLETFKSESVSLPHGNAANVLVRQLHIGRQPYELVNLIATHAEESVSLQKVAANVGALLPDLSAPVSVSAEHFDGHSYYAIDGSGSLDMASQDFTILARLRTDSGGTIFSKSPANGPWVPDGTTFFIREGRLTYDIGWGRCRSIEEAD